MGGSNKIQWINKILYTINNLCKLICYIEMCNAEVPEVIFVCAMGFTFITQKIIIDLICSSVVNSFFNCVFYNGCLWGGNAFWTAWGFFTAVLCVGH